MERIGTRPSSAAQIVADIFSHFTEAMVRAGQLRHTVPAPATSGPFYLVFCHYGSRLGNEARCAPDTAAAHDYDTLVRDVASGEYASPYKVLLIDEAAGTVTDVSEQVAQDILRDAEQLSDEITNFIEQHTGHCVPLYMRG